MHWPPHLEELANSADQEAEEQYACAMQGSIWNAALHIDGCFRLALAGQTPTCVACFALHPAQRLQVVRFGNRLRDDHGDDACRSALRHYVISSDS